MSVLFSLLMLVSAATDPCDSPRIRDTGALSMAMTQDRQVAQAFQKAATACVKDTEACDQARLECGTLLAAALKGQISFDEGAWLRDMLLPYLGKVYPLTTQFAATGQANDTSCAGEPALLTSAATRRLAQAGKRQAIFDEYPKYAAWVNSAYAKCREQAGIDQQKAFVTRSEAEKLAAAAAAAKLAEELRQKNEDEARKKLELEAKLKADAQLKAAEEARARAKAQADATAQAEQAKKDAAKQVAQAQEDRLVQEREGKLTQAKSQKSLIIADAKAELDRATDESNAKHKLAMTALDERSPAAAQLASDAANAEKARLAAAQRLADAKVKADRIEVDESSQRSRGSLGIQGAAGYGALSGVDGSTAGLLLGVQAGVHFGFWGTAPSDGMASGLEVRVNARYLTQAGGPGVQRGFDARAMVRWFFGPVGVGAAFEYRLFESTLGATAHTFSGPGLGPSVGVAFIDTPTWRVMANLSWLPLLAADLLRFVGDFEVSWKFLVFGVAGGVQTDPTVLRSGFFITGLAGVRLGW